MVKESKPRRGSLQFWPRKRARRIYPRVRNWPAIDILKPLGFAGYKVGMTHVIAIDNRKNSPTKGEKIFIPVTVIEVPPLRVIGLRFYRNTVYGKKTIGDYYAENLPGDYLKDLKRKITTFRPTKKLTKDSLSNLEFDEVRLIVGTQPRLAGIRKKKPEVFEIALGGNDPKEKLEYALERLGGEINVREVFKEGQLVDVIAVTKGKGTQGPIKRFGVKRLSHKTEKKRRKPGNYGPWHPAWINFRRAVMPGQMGFHTRTEHNKWLLKISDNPEEINPKGGWLHYGVIKSQYLLLKGSVPGPAKRLIILRDPVRPDPKIPNVPPEIVYVHRGA